MTTKKSLEFLAQHRDVGILRERAKRVLALYAELLSGQINVT